MNSIFIPLFMLDVYEVFISILLIWETIIYHITMDKNMF